MHFNPEIFKAYDIRGLIGKDWDMEFVERLGRAFVLHTGAKTVVVGRDMRGTSLEYSAALARGIMKQGADVIDIGLVTSPMFYYAVIEYDLHDAGVMITASHNPAEYNGFKLLRGDGIPMGRDSGGLEIARLVEAGLPPEASAKGGEGTLITTDIRESYLASLWKLIPPETISKLTVAADAGNGTSGVILPDVFLSLPTVKVHPLYWEPDGSFPNHEANPLKEETLTALKSKIAETRADVGFAFDGDSDRIGLVDENGVLIRGDQIVAFLASVLLPASQKKKVALTTNCGRIVGETVEALGGEIVWTPTGHALIKPIIRRESCLFGGELSGHFYFADFGAAENTDFMMLLVLQQLTRSGRKMSELFAPFRKHFHSGEFNFKVSDRAAKIAELKARYAPGAERVIDVDGPRIEFKDWWLSLRASNTEPLVRLNVEALTKELMEAKTKELSELLSS
jgi:phosphomannomutase